MTGKKLCGCLEVTVFGRPAVKNCVVAEHERTAW